MATFKIINVVEDKIILNTSNRIEFVRKVQEIFNENETDKLLQKPESTLGCKRYIDEYCDNLKVKICV